MSEIKDLKKEHKKLETITKSSHEEKIKRSHLRLLDEFKRVKKVKIESER